MTNAPSASPPVRNPLNHVPDKGIVALLLIDVINDLEFPGGDTLGYHFLPNFLDDGIRGREIVNLLQPDEDDYFILKLKHSAFFGTNLEILLRNLGTTTLILTGVAGIAACSSRRMTRTCATSRSSFRRTASPPRTPGRTAP